MMILPRCQVQLCGGRRRHAHFCCKRCWERLPRWLRDAIAAERWNCREARVAHSQELHALRDKAIELLSERNRERFEKQAAVQLALPC